MRIFFVAPRYHTNQIPIVNHLLKMGYDIKFLVYHRGIIEDYSTICPTVIPSNHIFRLYYNLKYKNKADEVKEDYFIRHFIPSCSFLLSYLYKEKPDILVLRGYGECSIICNLLGKLLGINRIVLYTQAPQYLSKDKRWGMLKKIYRRLLPKLEYTPVEIKDGLLEPEFMIKTQRMFIPFVMDFPSDMINRIYLKSNKINLLDIGKFRDYKNHFILVKAFARMPINIQKMFRVTIIGQVSTASEESYFNELQRCVDELSLNEVIRIKKNVPYKEMGGVYKEHDVFILTSKKEEASISVLEALSYGLVCVSTSYNGTATYIPKDYGFLFKSEDVESLLNVLQKLAANKSSIPEWGQKSFNYAKVNYSPEVYESKLQELCRF